MKSRVGTCITKRDSGEAYKAYIPAKLPPEPPLELVKLYPLIDKATRALAELNGITQSIPNSSLFIYMYVRKEALLSSQIEGTQSSFSDLMLFESSLKPDVTADDVEHVSNYVKAINHGVQRLKDGFPLSLRLLKEVHAILLSDGRGTHKLPGEFRRSQNWIGGTRPGNALFVPPPAEYLAKCLADLERFLHDTTLPVLIKAGLVHVQFETIHPFLDGNGRLGRLLITLLLCEGNMLNEPVLYLSLYLKQNRATYYDLLQEVRTQGTWETWLEFFLQGIVVTSKQAIKTTLKINALFKSDNEKIATLGRAQHTGAAVFEFLKTLPQVNAALIEKQLNVTAPTARSALKNLARLGIVEEVTGKKRGKTYVYRRYMTILEEGTEPLIAFSQS